MDIGVPARNFVSTRNGKGGQTLGSALRERPSFSLQNSRIVRLRRRSRPRNGKGGHHWESGSRETPLQRVVGATRNLSSHAAHESVVASG